jgi:prepilin-type N-terminal cleavage/methylation domain-containing protein
MKRAFTLIELLITMGILAALAAFTVPTYQIIISQFQLTSSVNEVADFLRFAEQKTVTEQKIYGVTLTVGATTIPHFQYDPSSEAKTSVSTYSLPSNIKIGEVNFSENADIRFATSGAPNVSGNLVLTDTARGKSRRIEIRPSGAIFITGGEF